MESGATGMRPVNCCTFLGVNSSCCTLWPRRPYPPLPVQTLPQCESDTDQEPSTSAAPATSQGLWACKICTMTLQHFPPNLCTTFPSTGAFGQLCDCSQRPS